MISKLCTTLFSIETLDIQYPVDIITELCSYCGNYFSVLWCNVQTQPNCETGALERK